MLKFRRCRITWTKIKIKILRYSKQWFTIKKSDHKLLGFDKSRRKNKMYDALILERKTNKIIRVPFGDSTMENYQDKTGLNMYPHLIHIDPERRKRFRARHKGFFSITDGGQGVAWNGTRWVAVGKGTNTIAYSRDGITWTGVTGSTSIFTSDGFGVASNPRVGATIVDSQIVISKYKGVNSNFKLDIVQDSYNNIGFSDMVIKVVT